MNNTFDTYQAEIEYRANRIRKEISGDRRVRNPFVRKPTRSRSSR
jgi:hypothetical protein